MKCAYVIPGPVFCLLLGVNSDCARPITGQITSVIIQSIFWPVWLWSFMDDLQNHREPLLFSARHFKAIGKFKQDSQSGNAQFYSIFCLACVTLELTDGLENNKVPLLCFKLCASFHNHCWIQTRVTVRKHLNWGKICFDLRPHTLTVCMDNTFVNGNITIETRWYVDRNIVKKV